MAKLHLRRKASERPLSGRSQSTVFWHRALRAFLHLVAWIFLLLVVIGNVSDGPVMRNTYFLKINMANIVPISVPNAQLINSIARTIGLHDFYQVGLWNFCEGYFNTGITHCSEPQGLYYFNPVHILLSELLAGATIALPAGISDALAIARVASFWMFGLFMTAAILTFVLIFLTPLAVSSRPPQSLSADPQINQTHPPRRRRFFVLLRAFPFLVIVFLNAVFTIGASVIATAMFSIFAKVFTENQDINIQAWLGGRMMAFMWIASACNLIAFIVQFASCCAACCGGRKTRKQLKASEKGKQGEEQEQGEMTEKAANSSPRNESTMDSGDVYG